MEVYTVSLNDISDEKKRETHLSCRNRKSAICIDVKYILYTKFVLLKMGDAKTN